MSLDDLLAAVRSGEPGARKALALALYDVLRIFFRRRCFPGDAEDLVQATLVVILRVLDGFESKHPRAFEALVFTTAGRVLFTTRRSWSREYDRRVDSPPVAVALDTSVSEWLARREAVDEVLAAVDRLDSADRREIHDYLAEIGWREQEAIEGVARATQRTRRHRALERLRKLFGRAPKPSRMPEPLAS